MKNEFNAIIKTSVSPLLRQAGFHRRGQTFTRPAGPYTQVLNIQRSAFNHNELCNFWVNTGIYVPSVVSAYFLKPPSIHPIEPVCLLRKRSYEIAGERPKNFSITPSTSLSALQAEMAQHMKDVVLPYLDTLQNRDSVSKSLDAQLRDPQQQVFRAIFFICEGDRDRGIQELQDLVQKAKNSVYKTSLINLGKRLGISMDEE